MRSPTLLTLALAALLAACGEDKDEDSGGTDTATDSVTGTGTATGTATGTTPGTTDGVPLQYEFTSRFDGASSVSYSGQILRHVLIEDLKLHLGGLTARLDGGFFPVPGEVEEELDFYFSFDSATSGQVPLYVSTDPAPLQSVYDDVSNTKNLVEKIAGNDAVGQHEDWNTAFVGWPQAGVTSPETLVRTWFTEIDAAAVDWSNGDIPLGPDGEPVPAVYVSADGVDRQQLLQKFLLGAVAFSQGADDYLDDADAGKGILSPNTDAEDGANYTTLEHGWDEGFGWFGASRDYPTWSDDAIAAAPWADTFVADGAIDLKTEYAWGAAQSAAKRDAGAIDPTDFTFEAWEGFVLGRKLITDAGGELDDAQLAELRVHRDQAVSAWEKALSASAVHYINDVLKEMNTFGTVDYDFAAHAKVWSELKGFALSLQFNPRSPLSDDDFATLHALLGTHPVLPTAGQAQIDAYREDLLAARDLLGDAYGFTDANLGDDNGENGW